MSTNLVVLFPGDGRVQSPAKQVAVVKSSRFRRCSVRAIRGLPAMLAALFVLACSGAGAAEFAPPAPMLLLTTGDFLAGEFRDSDQADILRWQNGAFAEPFGFPWKAVKLIQFPAEGEKEQPQGTFCFELSGGDTLYGKLVGMSADRVDIDVPDIGRVHLRRSHLRRVLPRTGSAGLVYVGPHGLKGWKQRSTKTSWREDSGQLVNQEFGGTIFGDFGIPSQASIEIELSWEKNPDFILALGLDANVQQVDKAFRLEVWDDDLVAVRETTDDADVSSLGKISRGPGRIQLLAYLDQENQRLIVFSADGRQLADLTVSPEKSEPMTGIRLTNRQGDLRLERLRISRWNGEPPREVRTDESRIHRSDGAIVYGEIETFDAASGKFIVSSGTRKTSIAADEIGSIMLPGTDTSDPSPVTATLRDGARLGGTCLKVESGRMWLRHDGLLHPVSLPVSELRAITTGNLDSRVGLVGKRIGCLELEDARSYGSLVDGREQDEASCLVWHPRGSLTASPLRHGVSGRVIYQEQRPQRNPRAAANRGDAIPGQQNRRVIQLGNGIVRIENNGVVRIHNVRVGQPQINVLQPSLHLRTGDTIPCQVTRINEQGVAIVTPVSDAKFIPHEKIKAVELANEALTIQVDDLERERLLTLPRMQRRNPPTHLIRSTSGDYLRGQLTEMDDATLTMEMRLEKHHIDREHVSRIIWLHPDGPQSDAVEPELPAHTRAQVIYRTGNRLTFSPDEMTGTTLAGTSEVLGDCRVDLTSVDQVLFGHAIEDAAAELAYGIWTLKQAIEPKFVNADGEPTAPSDGMESPLVGKPAPDFDLALLDGNRFQLSEQRGRVIVLDFWASWCGPCIQAMPELHGVVEEFQNQDVQLVAVNLMEGPERITAALERLNLQPAVALDHNGTVAEKYSATAIPQTVIIDREGNVARLFVGGGPHFADQIREALEAVLNGEPEEEKADDTP